MDKYFALIALIALVVAACSSSAESTGIEPVECSPTSTLTYENFGRELMETRCSECHAVDESPRLTSLAVIRANADDILDQAVYTTAMPEEKSMPLEERAMLGEWLACDAP